MWLGRRNLIKALWLGFIDAGNPPAAAALPDGIHAPGSNTVEQARAVHMSIDVRDFGAIGDGIADDAPAINRAFQKLRDITRSIADVPISGRLLFPSGIYRVSSTIDMTYIRAVNTIVEGQGSALLGQTEGQPVVDALGSRWLEIRDITIIGDSQAVPLLGLQIGRAKKGEVADDHVLRNVKFMGQYSRACMLNLAAETCLFDHVLFWNDCPGKDSYCVIQDGLNFFDTQSQFLPTVLLSRGSDESFNENLFLNCDFRNFRGGRGVWLGDTSRHQFIRCYCAVTGDAAFLLYSGKNSNRDLMIDCHCETADMLSTVRLEAEGSDIRIRGLTLIDHMCFAKDFVFALSSRIRSVRVDGLSIEIGEFAQGCRVFERPDIWVVSGRYKGPNGSGFDVKNFTGELNIGSSISYSGMIIPKVLRSDTISRGASLEAGTIFFDKNSGKLVVWSGDRWVDSNGVPIRLSRGG